MLMESVAELDSHDVANDTLLSLFLACHQPIPSG
jgi:hypothetical protein